MNAVVASPCGKGRMAQAVDQKPLVGGDAERRDLFEAADQLAPRLVRGFRHG